ncbi:hypothetical protein Tco_0821432 [Tanacetum coccineum]|uniref:Uncharacterized protein n=1 Tax=Tanacetum coccineum TaxID=301880 RepID=A0ABQ5AD81_9ASTR
MKVWNGAMEATAKPHGDKLKSVLVPAVSLGRNVEFENLDNYVLVRDRAKRTTTIPARYKDESNVSLFRPSGSREQDDMVTYAFAIAEEEDTHEPITFLDAINSSKNDEWMR